MIAVGNRVEERTLSFSSTSLLSNDSPWTITGTGTLGSIMKLDGGDIASLTLSSVNKRFTYLKLVAVMHTLDSTLSTKSAKNVAVVYTINYADVNISPTTDIFYPNFDFEENAEYYTIIELSGDKVSSINVQIINSEEETIDITYTALHYMTVVDQGNISEELYENYQVDDSYFTNLMDQYMQDHGISPNKLIIPGYTSIPPLADLQEGETFRLISASILPIGGV